MGIFKPRRTMEAPNVNFGVCLWRLPDGTYIQDDKGNYLNIQARVGDQLAEHKMHSSARDLGITEGQIWWLPGFRQISESEWCDQMERLQDGKIPDPVDVYFQNEGLWGDK